MAVAETARLIASYEFQNKGGAGAAAAARQLAGVEKAAGRTQGAFTRLGQGLKTGFGSLAKIGAAGAVVGLGLLAGAIKGGIAAQKELERVTAQTNAVIKSTRGVAGQSADAIAALANKYEDLNATMDNKVIQSGANVLLTFTKITKQGFEPALEAALNLNQAMGGGAGGLQGAIVLVGKALNDPVKGLAALGRVGVSFTSDQKALIKSLVSENKLLEAQQVILKELGTEFGGSFAAAGKTAEGTFASLGDAVEELQLALVQGLMPGLLTVSRELTTLFKSEDFKKGAADLGKQIGGLFSADNIKGVKSFVSDVLPPLVDGLKLAGQATKTIVDLFRSLPPELQKAVVLGVVANKLTGGLVGAGIAGVVKGGVGAAIGGLRGATAATPIFTREVGIGGAAPGTAGNPMVSKVVGFLGVLAVAEIATLIARPLFDVAREISKSLPLSSERRAIGNLTNDLAWPFGPRNTPRLVFDTPIGPFDIFGGYQSGGQSNRGVKPSDFRPSGALPADFGDLGVAGGFATAPFASMFTPLEDEAEASGKRIPGRLADGILAARQAPVDAMDKVKALLASSMSETAQTTRLLGQLTSSELAAGLTDKDPAVRAASREARNTIINQLKDLGVTPGTLTKTGMDALILAMKNADPIIAAETTKIYNLVKGIVPTPAEMSGWINATMRTLATGLVAGLPAVLPPTLAPPRSPVPGTNTGGGIPNVGRSPLPTPAGPGEIPGRPPHLTQVTVRVSTDHRQNSGAAAINNRYGKTPAEAGAI